jgi:hypothetical protein
MAILRLFKSAQLAHIVSERWVHVSPTVSVKASTKFSPIDSPTPLSLKSPATSAGLRSLVTKMTGLSAAMLLRTTWWQKVDFSSSWGTSQQDETFIRRFLYIG